MRNIFYYGFFVLCIGLILSSCTLEKRRYSKGYNLNWNNNQPIGTSANLIDQPPGLKTYTYAETPNDTMAYDNSYEALVSHSAKSIQKSHKSSLTLKPINNKSGAIKEFVKGYVQGAKYVKKAMYDDEPEPKNHGLAITSMILGILSLITLYGALLFGLLAIIFGGVALNAISRDPERYKGRGMARAGLICGIISVAIIFVYILIVL